MIVPCKYDASKTHFFDYKISTTFLDWYTNKKLHVKSCLTTVKLPKTLSWVEIVKLFKVIEITNYKGPREREKIRISRSFSTRTSNYIKFNVLDTEYFLLSVWYRILYFCRRVFLGIFSFLVGHVVSYIVGLWINPGHMGPNQSWSYRSIWSTYACRWWVLDLLSRP